MRRTVLLFDCGGCGLVGVAICVACVLWHYAPAWHGYYEPTLVMLAPATNETAAVTTLVAHEMPRASLIALYFFLNIPIVLVINSCIMIGIGEPLGAKSLVIMHSNKWTIPFAFHYESKGPEVFITLREAETKVNPNVMGITLTLAALRVPIMVAADYLALSTVVQFSYGSANASKPADTLVGAVMATSAHFAVITQIALLAGLVALWFDVPNLITAYIWSGSTRAITAHEIAEAEGKAEKGVVVP